MLSKKKNKLLLISSSSDLGGGTKHMFMLGKEMSREFNVFYAIPKSNNFKEFLKSNNHIEITEREIKFTDIVKINKFIRSNSIDIIHAHGKGAGAIARLVNLTLRKPLIYTFHGIHLKCHTFIKRLIYIYYELFFGRLDSIKILVSESEKIYAIKNNIYLGKRFLVINNGVSLKPIKIYESLNKQFPNKLKINIITICRLVKQKNVKDILRIAEKVSEVNFTIVGDGELKEEIKDLIFMKGLINVNLIGATNNVFKYLYSSDIYLSTSLYEGLPLSIIEAMSIGLPIIASNVTGNSDTIIHGRSGFLYDSDKVIEATRYIKKLSQNKKLRSKMGYSAYKRQRKIFSEQKMYSQYKNLYKSFLC
tara:strand:+ start:419 stop:1507 length:1089 start_codon:yes stop_codon:yes gene_type:complete